MENVPSHRHLRNIDCLMARIACLVCFISTVNSRSKKRSLLTIKTSTSSGHISKLKQSILLIYLWFPLTVTEIIVYTQRGQIYTVMACTRSFDTGLTSAEDQKLECFKWTATNIFLTSMKIEWTLYVIKLCRYFFSSWLSLCVHWDLNGSRILPMSVVDWLV